MGLLALYPFYYYDNLGGNTTINAYYVFTLLTPSIVLAITYGLKLLSQHKLLHWWFRCLGKYSLEIYLVQVTIMSPIMFFLKKHNIPMIVNVFLSFSIVFLLSVSMKIVTDKAKMFFKL